MLTWVNNLHGIAPYLYVERNAPFQSPFSTS